MNPTNQSAKPKAQRTDQKHDQKVIKTHEVMISSDSTGQPVLILSGHAMVLNMIRDIEYVLFSSFFL